MSTSQPPSAGASPEFTVPLPEQLPEAIDRVTAALKDEGFGVLTRIDVHDTLKQKIGVDFRPFVILGACNPHLAHRALQATPDVGLLLPCNVTVEKADHGGSLIRIVDPEVMMGAAGGGGAPDPELAAVACEARERLARVAAALRT